MEKKQKIYRNAKQFSIFFLSENCFDKNYPNAFLVLFSVFKHLFNKKNNRKLFFFSSCFCSQKQFSKTKTKTDLSNGLLVANGRNYMD
jgi:hypothetical protein